MPIRPIGPPLRRRASTTAAVVAALTTTALLVPFAGPASAVAAPTVTAPGLFGVQDPTYDGVYRQSLAILSYVALDEEPPTAAVDWLLDQQCANGGWQAFRADTGTACAASDISTYSGPDSNSTALAVQALLAVGADDAASDGLDFLEDLQQPDGGIAYLEGAGSDTNSTALAAAAVSAAGIDLDDATASSGRSLRDALAAAQIGCEGGASERGGYRFLADDDPFGNDFASVQAVLGASGEGLPVSGTSVDENQAPVACPAAGSPTSSERNVAGAWYLAQKLAAGEGTIESAYSPGTTDWGSTRFAVIALAASGHGRSAMTTALAALAGSQGSTITDDDGNDRAGVLAELILADAAASSALSGPSVASSTPARSPRPAPVPSARPTPSATATPTATATALPTETSATTAPSETPAVASIPETSPTVDSTATAPTAEAAATATPTASATAAATSTAARRSVGGTVTAQAEAPSIDSAALLARLDATLQVAATTPPSTTSAGTPTGTTSADPSSSADVNSAGLARTGGSVPLLPTLTAASLLLLMGAALTMLTSRRARGHH